MEGETEKGPTRHLVLRLSQKEGEAEEQEGDPGEEGEAEEEEGDLGVGARG